MVTQGMCFWCYVSKGMPKPESVGSSYFDTHPYINTLGKWLGMTSILCPVRSLWHGGLPTCCFPPCPFGGNARHCRNAFCLPRLVCVVYSEWIVLIGPCLQEVSAMVVSHDAIGTAQLRAGRI